MTKERAKQKAIKYREWAEKKELKLREMEKQHLNFLNNFDWTEPIKIGHHSQRKHEKMFEKRESQMRKIVEMSLSISRMREKAENLDLFASRNKGDADRKRQALREDNDTKVKVGDIVKTVYGMREILKINKKTYTLKGEIKNFTLDKSFLLN